MLLINLGTEPFEITRGMRIAQMIIAPVATATLIVVDDLDETHRGERGFGSTWVLAPINKHNPRRFGAGC